MEENLKKLKYTNNIIIGSQSIINSILTLCSGTCNRQFAVADCRGGRLSLLNKINVNLHAVQSKVTNTKFRELGGSGDKHVEQHIQRRAVQPCRAGGEKWNGPRRHTQQKREREMCGEVFKNVLLFVVDF